MRKTLMRCLMLALCLLMLTGTSAFADTGELIDVSDGVSGAASGPGGGASETPPPPPEPEASYIITVAAPLGWHTKSAVATIKLEDTNGAGFSQAAAKFGANGAWQDISDSLRSYGWAHVEIADNGTVYVSVTDKKGKAHVKSLYIECFDREAPTLRAKIEGRTLRVEADDALSGVECVYVNGYSLDDLTNGDADIRVKEFVSEDEEEIFVYAVDCAGNRSKTVQVRNPYYKPPQSSRPASSVPTPSAPPSQAPVVVSQPPVVPAPVPSQPAASAPPQTVTPPSREPEQPAVSDAPADFGSVTPTDGSGSVIENSNKSPEQREFFTITTEAGNAFYIVVDKEKTGQNVYLLSEVTEDDLAGLAKPPAGTATVTPPASDPAPVVTPEPDPAPPPEDTADGEESELPAPEKPSNTGAIIFAVILALAFGGGAYYFKIVRPKQNGGDQDDEEGEGGSGEEDDTEYEMMDDEEGE